MMDTSETSSAVKRRRLGPSKTQKSKKCKLTSVTNFKKAVVVSRELSRVEKYDHTKQPGSLDTPNKHANLVTKQYDSVHKLNVLRPSRLNIPATKSRSHRSPVPIFDSNNVPSDNLLPRQSATGSGTYNCSPSKFNENMNIEIESKKRVFHVHSSPASPLRPCTSGPCKSPIMINRIFPPLIDWDPGTLQYGMYPLPTPPNPLTATRPRRRTSKSCVSNLSLLLDDESVPPRVLNLSCRDFITKKQWSHLQEVCISLWKKITGGYSDLIRSFGYTFQYHCVTVLCHAVHGVLALRPMSCELDGRYFGKQHSIDGSVPLPMAPIAPRPPAIPDKEMRQCPPRYVRAVHVVPAYPMLSGCIARAFHLNQFGFSLAPLGEAHGLWHIMIASMRDKEYNVDIHRESWVDLYSLSKRTIIL
jgi:hypothetical protein